jgi:hypothetical protein
MYLYDDIADLYQGINCTNNPDMRCYNEELWCPANGTSCVTDNAAYPYGDLRVYSTQMSDPYALAPFPNSLFWNWATILILGFGNLGALDFQVRCMASKTPRIARIGCFIGGLFTFFVGIPFSFLGPITRVYYGPDSPHAMFEADTCSAALGLVRKEMPTAPTYRFKDAYPVLTCKRRSIIAYMCRVGPRSCGFY